MLLLAFVLTISAAFCWAAGQIIAKIALTTINLSVYMATRVLFSLPFIVSFIVLTNSFEYPGLEMILLASLVGVADMFVAALLFYYLLKRDTAYRIIPIGNTYPLWGVIAAVLVLGEQANVSLFISTSLVILGAFFLAQKGKKMGHHRAGRVGILIAFLPAIVWGLAIVLTKYCLIGMTEGTLLTISVFSATAACSSLMGVNTIKTHLKFDRKGIKLSIVSGLLIYCTGQLMYLYALKIESASSISITTAAIIPFAFILSVLFLKERPTRRAILGMISILTGVLLVGA